MPPPWWEHRVGCFSGDGHYFERSINVLLCAPVRGATASQVWLQAQVGQKRGILIPLQLGWPNMLQQESGQAKGRYENEQSLSISSA